LTQVPFNRAAKYDLYIGLTARDQHPFPSPLSSMLLWPMQSEIRIQENPKTELHCILISPLWYWISSLI